MFVYSYTLQELYFDVSLGEGPTCYFISLFPAANSTRLLELLFMAAIVNIAERNNDPAMKI